VFSRKKADLRRHVECVQLAAALLFDRQRTLRTESGSKLHALHMKELAKHIPSVRAWKDRACCIAYFAMYVFLISVHRRFLKDFGKKPKTTILP
jgi:hypothetical protein